MRAITSISGTCTYTLCVECMGNLLCSDIIGSATKGHDAERDMKVKLVRLLRILRFVLPGSGALGENLSGMRIVRVRWVELP